MKRFLILFLLLAKIALIGQAQEVNPYRSFGYEVKGKYVMTKEKEGILLLNKENAAQNLLINPKNKQISVLDSSLNVLTSYEISDRVQTRFLSVDPLTKSFSELTPYQFASNSPIANIDLDGGEAYWYKIDFDNKTKSAHIKLVNTKTSYLDAIMPYSMVISYDGGDYKYSGSYWNFTDMNSYLNKIAKDPKTFYEYLATKQKQNENEFANNRQEWENIWTEGVTIAFATKAKFTKEFLSGSGPKAGLIELSSSSKSNKALLNYKPTGSIEFVYDFKNKKFVVGKPQEDLGGSPHQQLVKSIGAKGDNVVGGMFKVDGKGVIQTNEFSGHYGENWTPAIRKDFEKFMKQNTGKKIDHSEY